MKNKIFILFLLLILSDNAFADSYYFKNCKLSSAVTGDYIVNINKKKIETTLTATNGTIQNFSDKIKIIEDEQVISEKIESGAGDNTYFEYYLNYKKKTVIKLQYIKQSGIDLDVYKLQFKKVNFCADVKGGWDKDKIDKAEIDKEQEEILKAQKKIKKEQSSVINCVGADYKFWTKCKGVYKTQSGYIYEGLFISGKITKGTALFPGGAKYVGEFNDFKPHGFGNFGWANGDKYFGEWKDGKSHGTGTKLWKDGREYSGTFKDDKLHGQGTFYYPDGKKYEGGFINGKRHGEGTFTYPDGTAFIGKFIAGKQDGLGECVGLDGNAIPCASKTDTQKKDFSGKDTHNISLIAKKWVRISQYETNTKKGKKIMDKLKSDFEVEALEICSLKGQYSVLDKKIEVLEIDETPAYGLETKLKIGISGVVECK